MNVREAFERFNENLPNVKIMANGKVFGSKDGLGWRLGVQGLGGYPPKRGVFPPRMRVGSNLPLRVAIGRLIRL